jgi:hypothetical protein
MLRPGQPGTAMFATLALLGAAFVAPYPAFMTYGPASVFVSLQTVTAVSHPSPSPSVRVAAWKRLSTHFIR